MKYFGSQILFGASAKVLGITLFLQSICSLLPRLLLSSTVYSSAKPTALRILDSTHNSSIRLATGAFCSSSVVSLLAELEEPPLSVRLAQLRCNYYFILKSKPNLPTHNLVFGHSLTDEDNL